VALAQQFLIENCAVFQAHNAHLAAVTVFVDDGQFDFFVQSQRAGQARGLCAAGLAGLMLALLYNSRYR
jgi:hypothetical protein